MERGGAGGVEWSRVEWNGCTGAVHANSLASSRLAAERAAAIDGLFTAMKNHYSSVEPPLVRALAEEIAALFKRAEDLKKLGADVATLFPGELGPSSSDIFYLSHCSV